MAKLKSWQIFHAAKNSLGDIYMGSLYKRSAPLVSKWCADPSIASGKGSSERNPLDRIQDMLVALDSAGLGIYSRAAIDYLAEPLGGGFDYKDQSKSDKGTIDGELADISIALGSLGAQVREALEDGRVDSAEKIRIKEAARNTKREIEQLLDAAGIDEK